MQSSHVPAAGWRYWVILAIASTFGANLGDFVSSYLRLGHARGLLPLAILLGVVLQVERRSRWRTDAFYWAAIVVIRTGATNLADLLNFDLDLGYPGVLAGLILALVAVVGAAALRRGAATDDPSRGLPPTDGSYWLAMIVAGTLGTVIGDLCSFGLDWGTGRASVVLALPMAALVALCLWRIPPPAAIYWAAVVAVRATATAWGDHLAKSPTLKLGLPLSTLLTGVLLGLVILAWRDAAGRPAAR